MQQYIDKFSSLGISVHDSQIINSGIATAKYMEKKLKTGTCYVVGSPSLCDTLSRYSGFNIIDATEDCKNRPSDFRFHDLDTLNPDVSCVVVGLDSQISYTKIHRAAMYLRYKNCAFLGTNRDGCAPLLASGTFVPGAGSVVSAVECASGKTPIVTGKPSQFFLQSIMDDNLLDPSRCLMVGDRYDTDILFGRRGGLKTLMVYSGVTSRESIKGILENASENELPHYISDDIQCLSY